MRWLVLGLSVFVRSALATGIPAPPAEDLASAVAWECNAARQQMGLPAVRPDNGLSRVAFSHSLNMGTRLFWGHVDPEGRTPRARVLETYHDFRGGVAENLWKCTGCARLSVEELARRAVRAWLESPGHRQNLLHPQATHAGIGVWTVGDSVYVTQILAFFANSARR
jgi:uncharacterized protein YkwD